ncbi:dynein light chain roadblock-type [Strigomonas culicis]|uniref:Dynein light chain roadblock-type n=1 Tax=Strigomonas culicis TaxID=28005 RepID=S9V4B6_9TRYP|nr:dynein light chain roadblock-type [Strigomonas culicis]|eukprot:EPY35733.1 dynein light chain roadblock-type [Strigomonas culicis]
MAAAGGSDIEELIKRVTMHPGVQGFLIINSDGICVRHSFTEASRALAVHYAALMQGLTFKTKQVLQELDSSSMANHTHHHVSVGNNNATMNNTMVSTTATGNNELQFIRLRTRKDEIIIAPDNKYILVVIQQDPSYVPSEADVTTAAPTS